eukprot:8299238-Pyramimonas_sp.AAC.1
MAVSHAPLADTKGRMALPAVGVGDLDRYSVGCSDAIPATTGAGLSATATSRAVSSFAKSRSKHVSTPRFRTRPNAWQP